LFPYSIQIDAFLGTCANLGKLNIKALKDNFIFLKDRKLSSTIQHSSNFKTNHPKNFTWDDKDKKMYNRTSPNMKILLIVLLLLCILFFLLFIFMLFLALKWRKN
jgi:hypothetical protein